MNEEAQRVAIANACNWTQHGDEGVYGCWDDPNQITRTDCPDYLNDLNAMHSAEKTLDYHGNRRYEVELRKACSHSGIESCDFGVFTATAAQRAEAFLRTIGKWEDGK